MHRILNIIALSIPLAGNFLAQSETDSVNFAEHVAPILYENCVVCHRPDGVGPFSLIGYETARKRSRQISEVTASRFMPPWKPNPNYGPKFQGERALTADQITTLTTWYEQGMPAGDLSKAPKPPSFPKTWQLGQPDLILEFPESYQLQADGTDIYRNFVIPIPLDSPKYVRAIEFLPSSQLVIHHAVIQVDKTATSREKDQLEPGPGFDGMGIGAAAPPEGQLVGWTPGQSPYQSYPGTAWELEPGSDVVIQLHLQPSGKTESVSPKVGLYFTDEAPTRSSYIMQLREFDLNIDPEDSNYTIEESIKIPVDSEIIGLYPHAHYIGKDLGAYAIFPDGSKNWLFRITDWDFNWQSDYRYETPIKIPAGSKIHMSYVFDNSSDNIRNPNAPPQRILSGWTSTDEMAELSIQIIPSDEQDLDQLKQAQVQYEIDSAGGRSQYSYNLGSYYELQGLMEKAAEYYYGAIQDDPAFASAHFKLGHILERRGNIPAAESRYRQALALRPELIPANIGLARIHYLNRADFLAVDLLEQVLEWEPRNSEARIYLARIHQSNSKLDKALDTLKPGLAFHKENLFFRL
ncbi:MAG: tetratricopeptide repeat protein, partial [Opitutales bacterium]|nr:tetratricopeptide repeat protein [Opitutales bacterium]